MIPNAILITNGKGGVGKTSLTANLAGIAANTGWRTLAIDTDPQGNLARDLGVINDTDDGHNLADAILGRGTLAPMRDVRPGLDLAAGGHHLDTVTPEITTLMIRGHYQSALTRLETALTPLADDYDLIVIDSPPGDRSLQTLAARAAHHLLIPTAPDDCSIDGLANVFDRYHHLRTEGGNPHLNILGVALTLTVTNATSIRQRARHTLTELLGANIPVFTHTIRYAQAAAIDCRRRGLLAHEYEQHRQAAPAWHQRLRGGDRTGVADVDTYSSAASALAADYQQLVSEILAAYLHHHQLTAVPA